MSRRHALRVIMTLRRLGPEQRVRLLAELPQPLLRAVIDEWWWQRRGGQIEPPGNWRIWSIVAGRGFGKTRAGAEWVWQRARDHPAARIALVGATFEEVAQVMVEGESGLLAVARAGEAPRWRSSRGILEFPSGAAAFAYTAEKPDKLRGPQHHFAWCDELAKWPRADATWDNLMFGLRLGEAPRTIVTTTPRPVPILKRILALKRSVETRGRTADNPDSAPDFRTAMDETYGGTRLGRQELDGILFDDPEGALWTREMLEQGRAPAWGAGRDSHFHAPSGDWMRGGAESDCPCHRIVVGVDPPAGRGGDACGIVVCGMAGDGIAYVLDDLSAPGLRPEGWARRVAEAVEMWDAQLVVAEKNQGGDMIESVLLAAESGLPLRLVHAARGKAARAEPVALRFETGRARLAGTFPELEDQLCAFTHAGYTGPASPDRADAMVWAMTDLFKPQGEPRIRML